MMFSTYSVQVSRSPSHLIKGCMNDAHFDQDFIDRLICRQDTAGYKIKPDTHDTFNKSDAQ